METEVKTTLRDLSEFLSRFYNEVTNIDKEKIDKWEFIKNFIFHELG